MGIKSFTTNWPFEHDGRRYETGATVELDEELAAPLVGGVLTEVTTPAAAAEDGRLTDEELAELGVEVKGGGYYVLPTGERVRGRAAVLDWAEMAEDPDRDAGEPTLDAPPADDAGE
jgi:hypothetical protein